MFEAGGTPHIPIEGIWSDIQSSVRGDTAQNSKMLEKQGGGGHRTFKYRISGQMFNLGWGHRTQISKILRLRGGTFQLRWSKL